MDSAVEENALRGAESGVLALPILSQAPQPPPPSISISLNPALSTCAPDAMSLPVAFDSAVLHIARQRHGNNSVESTTVGFFNFLRYAIVSPTVLFIMGILVFHLTVCVDVSAIVVLLYLLLALVIAVGQSAYSNRRRVSTLQRCLPHSSAVAYREGTWALVGSTQLVPGDLVQLLEGCAVHADCALYRGSLLLDVSSLVGSSDLITATPGHLVKAGTVVVGGAGSAVVRYTGSDTYIGHTIKLLQHLALGLTRPLVERSYLLVGFTILVVVVTVELVLYGLFGGRFRWSAARVAREMALYAWVCLPLHLDVAVLQAVTRGASMAAQRTQAIVLRLGSLLGLASMDTLVIDKSGTLTTGVYAVTNAFRSFSPHYPSRDSLVQLMALAMKWREPSPHPMRRAVLRGADLDVCDQYRQLAYVEHEGEHRASAVLMQADGTVLRVTEGQVSSVLAFLNANRANPRSNNSGGNDTAVSAFGQDAEHVREWAEARRLETAWGYHGLRTRAVAIKKDEDGPWALAGLVTFEDALRDNAAELVKSCEESGVSVTIASGDSKAVVTAVAAALFSARPSFHVMIGGDVPALNARQVLNAASVTSSITSSWVTAGLPAPAADVNVSAEDGKAYVACRVYAEMQPQDKVSLVRLLQQCGLRVGVCGDGVNDAAAAHVADVGVALVIAENGAALTAQGAAWGADIALPSTRLTALSDLVLMSRELFATVYSLFFYAFTVTLQTAVFVGLAALMGPATCEYRAGQRSCTTTLAPSQLSLPLLIFLNVTSLLFQARQKGDITYWVAAPCHHSYAVAATQSAFMALVGVVGGIPLVMGFPLSLLFDDGDANNNDTYLTTMRATTVMMYLFYLQLYLTFICISPVRCGLRFLQCRVVFMVGFSVAVGVFVKFTNGFDFKVQLLLLWYCAFVSAVQDAAKLTVHFVCHRHNFFGYRGCVDRMTTGRRRWSRESRPLGTAHLPADDSVGDDDDDEGEDVRDEVSDDATSREPAAEAAGQSTLRPYSSALDAVLGCLAPVEMRLLRVSPQGPARTPEDIA